jgi:hypothetical protein
MKEEAKNEIDILLRRFGRQERNASSHETTESEHLDADELNAYSENAVPAKARLRYTEHLAECSRCRGIAAQLSQSAPVSNVPEMKTTEVSWLGSVFARLFSPFTLRYAIPVLAAVGIIAIGLVVLRRNENQPSLLAKRSQEVAVSVPAPAPAPTSNLEGQPKGTSQVQNDSLTENGRVAKASPSTKLFEEDKAAISMQKEPGESTAQNAKDQPLAVAGAAPPASTNSRIGKLEDAERQEQKGEASAAKEKEAESNRDLAKTAPKQAVANEARRVDELKPATAEDRASSQGYVSLGAARRAAQPATRTEKKDGDATSVESRTVAGRRFRREGNVWIDTAYTSSISTMSVARGSESYRALIADEPEIRTIAEQLDGEIVVVWKGKGYRIK